MSETGSSPRWKRALWLVLGVYAGLCTLLVTLYLGCLVWMHFFRPESQTIQTKFAFMTSLGEYMAKEHPKRGDRFCNLAVSLSAYSIDVPVSPADLFKYLGKPDLITGTEETGNLIYLYDHPGATNKWAVYASLQQGKLTHIGINDFTVNVNDHSAYRAYSAP